MEETKEGCETKRLLIKLDYLNPESTVYTEMKKKCAELGISISELCRQSNVNRAYIENLKTDTKTIKQIKKLIATLVKIEQNINLDNEVID
jgi:predicted transcriptional regulator